ncbi:MAG: hypothetical protein ACYCOU_02800 [Sulfobacillus sp.]
MPTCAPDLGSGESFLFRFYMVLHYNSVIIDGHQIFQDPKPGTQIAYARLFATTIRIMALNSVVYTGDHSFILTVTVTNTFAPDPTTSAITYYSEKNEIISIPLNKWVRTQNLHPAQIAVMPQHAITRSAVTPSKFVGNSSWSMAVSLKGYSPPIDRQLHVALQCDTGNT